MKRDLSNSKKIAFVACFILFGLIFWNKYSAIKLHQSYQNALMDSVTNSVLSDYQEHLNHLRADIDLFQYRHLEQIKKLAQQGPIATKEDYTALLDQLKEAIPDVRLFAIVDDEGHGILKHITGDFLPDCKEEIGSTITAGNQENLFIHRFKKSVHYDLLEPLITHKEQKWFFFVAFNTDILSELLVKYQLPYQQLFLLRKDNLGKVELSSEQSEDNKTEIQMTEDEIQEFNFLKNIPDTRWQLAIRLSPEYGTEIIRSTVIQAVALWLFSCCLIFVFYTSLRKRINTQLAIEEELAFESSHDSLTKTINRSTFEHELEQAITVLNTGCVFLIDIDNFQLVNNTYGYSNGDKCLNFISDWLVAHLPENAIISRLGNDEFAVLLKECNHQDTEHFANQLREQIQHLTIPRLPADLNLTASIGIFNIDDETQDVGTALNSLSQAVKLAKQNGGNAIQLYQSSDQALTQHAKEMAVVKDIRNALANDRFVLYRQQIVDLTCENTMKYEVLIRLQDENNHIIAPNVFIPASEKYGLIKHVDRWVIETTIKTIANHEATWATKYSINLSGVTIADSDMFDFVSQLIKKYNVNAERIGFEITETYAITHLDSAIDFITKMTNIGCEFSLDDFGSGLSSFSYLQQIPVHNIKIDGSFIKDICENRLNQVFVASMQKVVTEMGKRTVAEYVETAESLTFLKELGIDMVQGYHCHKPEPWQ